MARKKMRKSNDNSIKKGLTLYILRHGQAGTHEDNPEKDAVRPLTSRGRKETIMFGRSLRKLGVSFDLVVSSPLKRAVETAQLTARTVMGKKWVEEWNELKPTIETGELYSRLSSLETDRPVLLVGHEPHLSNVIAEIVSGKPDARLVLKKGGIAKVNVDELKPKPSGELIWLLTPKLMKKISRR